MRINSPSHPSRVSTGTCRVLASFASSDDGATAIEFALVAFPLLGTIAACMSLGIALYYSTSLDSAVRKAARSILTGSVRSGTTTASNYQTNTFCPLLPSAFDCSKVVLNIKVERTAAQTATSTGWADVANAQQTALLTTAYTSPATATFCTGQPGDYVYIQALYPLPTLIGLLSPTTSVATINGKPAFLLMATSAFRNEQFTANTGGC